MSDKSDTKKMQKSGDLVEDKLKDLETIVERLEKGEIGIEEAVQLYEKGMALAKAISLNLDQMEARIQRVSEGKILEFKPES